MKLRLAHALPFILSFAGLLYIIWGSLFHVNLPYDGFETMNLTGIVAAVDTGGPGAGIIQVGDVITQINGRQRSDSYPYYQDLVRGDDLVLTVLRNEQLIQVMIRLETIPPVILSVRLVPFLLALLFWMVGFLVYTYFSDNFTAFLFFVACQVGSIVLVSGANSVLGHPWAIRVFNGTLYLVGPVTVHFHHHFPRFGNGSKDSLRLKILYGVGVAGIAHFTILDLSDRQFESILHPVITTNRVFLSFCLTSAAAILISNYLKSKSNRVRGRIRIVTLGGSMGLIPITFLSLLPDVLLHQPLLPYHISFLLLGVIPVAYGYAILNDPVISSQGKIARSASNVLVFSLTAGLFLILLTMIQRLLPEDALQDPIILSIVVLSSAALYSPVQRLFKRLVSRAFYGGWYDYRSLVIHSTQKLSRTKNKDRLISSILDIAATMHFPTAAFFLPTGDAFRCQGSLGKFPHSFAAYRIPRKGALARQLGRLNHPVWNSELRQLLAGRPLSDDEKALLFHKPPILWVPLVTKGALRGLLFLESQFAEEWMSSEDLIILATLGALAALSSENVALLDALERQLAFTEDARAELQESRRRLLEGREAERLHLARELHDGPIQDLHGIRLLLNQASVIINSPTGNLLEERILAIIHELRDLCTQLRPPALTYFGLEAAMRSLADRFTAAHPEIELELSIDNQGPPLSDQASLALYRIYQEALNNIDQHANASQVSVQYAVSETCLQLKIRDDGSGFRVPSRLLEIARRGHLGLLGASERAESLGGNLKVISSPDRGTYLEATIPLDGLPGILSSELSGKDRTTMARSWDGLDQLPQESSTTQEEQP